MIIVYIPLHTCIVRFVTTVETGIMLSDIVSHMVAESSIIHILLNASRFNRMCEYYLLIFVDNQNIILQQKLHFGPTKYFSALQITNFIDLLVLRQGINLSLKHAMLYDNGLE